MSKTTPEERIDGPLKWEPTEPSSNSIAKLSTILDVAVNGNLISSDDAARMLRIIKLNPCSRIARIGQRLSLLESVIKEFQSIDHRLAFALKREEEELTAIRELTEDFWGPPVPDGAPNIEEQAV